MVWGPGVSRKKEKFRLAVFCSLSLENLPPWIGKVSPELHPEVFFPFQFPNTYSYIVSPSRSRLHPIRHRFRCISCKVLSSG